MGRPYASRVKCPFWRHILIMAIRKWQVVMVVCLIQPGIYRLITFLNLLRFRLEWNKLQRLLMLSSMKQSLS